MLSGPSSFWRSPRQSPRPSIHKHWGLTMATARPIGIYYEHPDWFRPLFNELDRRGVAYEALNADRHAYDATNGDGSHELPRSDER